MYKIVRKRELNPTVTQMEIEAPLVAKKAKPGQFIILRVDEDGERIPLTVAGTDPEEGTVKIIFQIVGATTETLNHKQQGEYIQDFAGPLGVATHTEGIKKVCIVGGGVGCAIAMPVAQEFHRLGAEVTSIIGFRSKDLLILEDEFRACSDKLVVMTGPIDMSSNWLIAAPRKWVEDNCPQLLTDEEYEYSTFIIHTNKETGKREDIEEKHTKKFSDFLCFPDEGDEPGEIHGHIADDWWCPEYCEANFGVTWNNSWWDDMSSDDDDDEEDDEEEKKED